MLNSAAGVAVLIPTLPVGSTVKKVWPELEATLKIGAVWAELDATRPKVASRVVVLIKCSWAVFSHRKLALPEVVEAALK